MAGERAIPPFVRSDGEARYLLHRELVALAGSEDYFEDLAGVGDEGRGIKRTATHSFRSILPRKRHYFPQNSIFTSRVGFQFFRIDIQEFNDSRSV